jgi:hypothetical protein
MRKEGGGGTMLAPVHRRSNVVTKQKDLGDDRVCGFRSRMVPTGLGCETCEDAGQEVRRSMGWLWPTSKPVFAPINRGNGLWYTVQYLTFAVVEAKDQASSLGSLSEISTRHQTRYVPGARLRYPKQLEIPTKS